MKPLKLLSLVPSLLLLGAPVRAEVLERIVAKVNGEIISLSDFQARQLGALRQAAVPPDEQEAFLREHNRQLLDEAIDDVLVAQRALEESKGIPDEYLNQYIEEMKKEYGIKTNEEFEAALRQEGITADDMRRNLERSLLTRRFMNDEIEKKVSITEPELRAEYEARRASEFTQPPMDQLQEIVLSTKEPGAEQRARSLVARARAGEDFATLAKQESVAPSREAGGDLGRVARRDMNAGLAEVVAQLSPGQISDPLPTKGGLRILRLVARDEGKVQPFDEVKQALRERLKARRTQEQTARLVKKLREHAIIQDMVREVPLQVAPTDSGGRPSLMEAVTGANPDAPVPANAPAHGEDEFATKSGEVKKVAPPPAPSTGSEAQSVRP
jgi:peptidyl-prolyl cis-trans isomerase SurA